MGRIIFVTGTDTGVGKIVLTGLLLTHLRSRGIRALAMKPFCTGDRGDVSFLQALQLDELSDDEVNPFWFRSPLAPLIAARKEGQQVSLTAAVTRVRRMAKRCEVLLVEGVGGALVPLTKSADVADLIARLDGEAILIGTNKLGVINHAKLTMEALSLRQVRRIKIVLMGQSNPDASSAHNARYLLERSANIGVFSIPFLGHDGAGSSAMREAAKKNQKVLAQICCFAKFSTRSLERRQKTARPKQRLARKKR